MRETLEKLGRGEISVDDAEKALKVDVVQKVEGIARLDVSRATRRGIPEIILAEGKSEEDLVAICKSMLEHNHRAIVSRVSDSQIFHTEKELRSSLHTRRVQACEKCCD